MAIYLRGLNGETWDFHKRVMEKWHSGNKDVFPLSVGDPNIPTSETILEAMERAIRNRDTGYLPVTGKKKVRENIANLVNRQYDNHIDFDNVLVTHGAQGALFLSIGSMINPGDKVAILEPVYLTNEDTIIASGGIPVRVSSVKALKGMPTKPKMIVLMNPVAPTGYIWTKAEMEEISKYCIENQVLCVCDEVYSELVYTGDFTSALSLSTWPVCVIKSASKTLAMPGMRMGWAIASKEWIKSMACMMSSTHSCLSGIMYEALDAGISHFDDISQNLVNTMRERKDIFEDSLGDLISPISSGMFYLIDVKKTRYNDVKKLATDLCNENISSLPVGNLSNELSGCLRLAISMPSHKLQQAGKVIRSICLS